MKLHPLFHIGDDITKVRTELKSNIELLKNEEVLREVIKNIREDEELQGILGVSVLFGIFVAYFAPEQGDEMLQKIGKGFKRIREENYEVELSSILLVEFFWLTKTKEQPSFSEELQRELQRLSKVHKLDPWTVLTDGVITEQHSTKFPFFFALLLRQMPTTKIHSFLTHQAHRFRGDFQGFLEGILMEYDFYEQKTIRTSTSWLSRSLSKIPVQATANPNEGMGLGQKKQIIIEELAFLKGSNDKGERILFDQTYECLLNHCFQFLEDLKIPNIEQSIAPKGVSNVEIRYAFYKIHQRIWGTHKIHIEVVEFIHAVFPQFRGDVSTTLKKFSTPPKNK